MHMKRINIQWKNLDLVSTTTLKGKKLAKKELMISVNSICFLNLMSLSFQKKDNRYAASGMLSLAREWIHEKKYEEAEALLDQVSSYWPHSSSLLFAKFVVSLFLGKESFPYLEESILSSSSFDSSFSYRLYVELFGKMKEEYDTIPLLEVLPPELPIVALNENSYNGKYLAFLKFVQEEDWKSALEKLHECEQMKPDLEDLEITEKLVDICLEQQRKAIELEKKQDKELEKKRIDVFLGYVKERDIKSAKEQLLSILAYRELEGKNNYTYHLFLELLETIEQVQQDMTYEVLSVAYDYQKEKDAFYTFQEAISVGDFPKAWQCGKKCKTKVLDSEHPKLKVGVYVDLLQYLFDCLEERQKEMENIYQIVESNIQKGHYTHALELYQIHKEGLKIYQEKLLISLFQAGIAIEKNVKREEEEEEPYEAIEEELEEIPLEVQNQDAIVEEEIQEKLEEISRCREEQEEPTDSSSSSKPEEVEETSLEEEKELVAETFLPKMVLGSKPKETTLYPVEPLLPHAIPSHDFFKKFIQYYHVGAWEEARYWLNQYDQLLHANQLSKRLDQFYYQIEIAYMDMLESPTVVGKKEEVYAYAYSCMRSHDYESALTYLDYYDRLDTTRNNKGLILKGYVESKMGNYEEAIQDFIAANAMSPDPDAYYFLGEIYYQEKKWNDAIFCYLMYNEFYPKERVDTYLNLSECYHKKGNLTRTLRYLHIADLINEEQNLGLHLQHRISKIQRLLDQMKEKQEQSKE